MYLNERILNNFIKQTQPKIKYKKYYITKNFQILPLSLSNPGVQPLIKSWCL